MTRPRKIIKFLASLKLAVITISLIAVITAIGTIVESKYDATAAKKLVYDSPWMYLIMGLFATNLTAVMVDRWPWRKHHAPFVFAHIGILLILLGSVLTLRWGLDGSIVVGIGQESRSVTVPETEVFVFSSFDAINYTRTHRVSVDFFRNSPRKMPLSLPVDEGEIVIENYEPYLLPQKKIEKVDNPRMGSGLRFQILNDRVNVVEWLVQRNPSALASHNFGPAQIHLGPPPVVGNGGNEIYLTPILKNGQSKIEYRVFGKNSLDPMKTGVIEEGGSFATGWMGLELKVLRFYPYAREEWDVKIRETPTPLTTEGIQAHFQGQKHWVLLNDTVKFFSKKAVYFLTYAQRQVEMGFPLILRDFKIDRYQGTQRAAGYKSLVSVPELGDREISMNEPLQHKGLTIYQSSFQEDPSGKPTASVFSVNYDPGRWVKYLGSLVMTVGIILLFYFRKRKRSAGGSK